MLRSKVYFGPVLIKYHGLFPKMRNSGLLSIIIPSERAPSILPENHKIVIARTLVTEPTLVLSNGVILGGQN